MRSALPALRFGAIVVAIWATACAYISYRADMAGDVKAWAVVALLAFGGYFWAKHIGDEQARREAERWAAAREDWFASFDRRRRMRGAR